MKSLLFIANLLVLAFNIDAQNIFPSSGAVGIGTTTPAASSLLEVKSTSKGVLVPRMIQAQRDAIASPATGLLIFQTDKTSGFYYYNGSAWTAVSPKGVNKNLSNLLSPTAINVSLIPGTTGTIDLGTNAQYWRNGYFSGDVVAASFTANGVMGTNPSNNGIGVWGEGTGSFGYGVYGYGNYIGVEGTSFNDGFGVAGHSSYIAVYGESSGWAGYFIGNVYASGVYSGSDQKLKQNIRDFTSAINIINQLKPKRYEFRQDGNYKLMNLPQGSHFGLIAQDVEKILPNLVSDAKFETRMAPRSKEASLKEETKSETIEFKALNYTELIPVIIKAMQEQQAMIENLLSANEKQQQQIDQLKQLINKSTSSSQSSSLNISTAYLKQNAPNPFSKNAIIECYVPSSITQAQLVICSVEGKQLKSYTVGSGMNEVTINSGVLSSGQYVYSLFVDGKKVDSKNMIITK